MAHIYIYIHTYMDMWGLNGVTVRLGLRNPKSWGLWGRSLNHRLLYKNVIHTGALCLVNVHASSSEQSLLLLTLHCYCYSSYCCGSLWCPFGKTMNQSLPPSYCRIRGV